MQYIIDYTDNAYSVLIWEVVSFRSNISFNLLFESMSLSRNLVLPKNKIPTGHRSEKCRVVFFWISYLFKLIEHCLSCPHFSEKVGKHLVIDKFFTYDFIPLLVIAGRVWLRTALNENTLESHLISILQHATLTRYSFMRWRFLRRSAPTPNPSFLVASLFLPSKWILTGNDGILVGNCKLTGITGNDG